MVVKMASLKLIQNLLKYVIAICSANLFYVTLIQKSRKRTLKRESNVGMSFQKGKVKLHPKMQDTINNKPTNNEQ